MFYVLIHYPYPQFLMDGSDVSGKPCGFKSYKEAKDCVERSEYCKSVGYSIMEWDAEQGGDGPLAINGSPVVD